MPTYEYICDACGHEFEKFQSMTAEPVKVCPKCGKRKVRKLISAGAGLIFKGSGFYITDYPKGDKGSAPKSYGGKSDKDAKADKPAVSTDSASKSEKSEKSSPSSDSSSSAPSSAPPAASSTPAAAPSASSSSSSSKD